MIAVAAVRGWAARRLRALRGEPGADHWRLLGERPDGRPAIVTFSSRGCSECRVQERVVARLGGVRLLRVDAHERDDLASRFGVVTVPTTVVLSADGTVSAVNHGLADADRLREQLGTGAADPAAAG